MINLLPENEKKNLAHEYSYRRAAVILFSLVIIVVMALLILAPTFILTLYKSRAVTFQQSSQDATSANQVELKKRVEEAKNLIRILKPAASSTIPTDIIDTLIRDKTSDNSINSIVFGLQTDGVTASLIVKGIAKSRNSLLSFTDALSQEPTIAKVDIPVSSFAKDTNISYTFTVTTK